MYINLKGKSLTLKRAIIRKRKTEYQELDTYFNVFDMLEDVSDFISEDITLWKDRIEYYGTDADPLLALEYVIPVDKGAFIGNIRIASIDSTCAKLYIGNNVFKISSDK